MPSPGTLSRSRCLVTIPMRVIRSQAARCGGRYHLRGSDSSASGGRSPGLSPAPSLAVAKARSSESGTGATSSALAGARVLRSPSHALVVCRVRAAVRTGGKGLAALPDRRRGRPRGRGHSPDGLLSRLRCEGVRGNAGRAQGSGRARDLLVRGPRGWRLDPSPGPLSSNRPCSSIWRSALVAWAGVRECSPEAARGQIESLSASHRSQCLGAAQAAGHNCSCPGHRCGSGVFRVPLRDWGWSDRKCRSLSACRWERGASSSGSCLSRSSLWDGLHDRVEGKQRLARRARSDHLLQHHARLRTRGGALSADGDPVVSVALGSALPIPWRLEPRRRSVLRRVLPLWKWEHLHFAQRRQPVDQR